MYQQVFQFSTAVRLRYQPGGLVEGCVHLLFQVKGQLDAVKKLQ